MHAPIRSAVTAVPAALLATVLCAGCTPAAAPAPPATVAPPVAEAASTRPAPPEPAPVVVLDPGHNGGNGAASAEIARPVPDGRGGTKPCNTTGTEAADGSPEHAFAWDLAQRVRTRLESAGVRVVLTRDSDDGVGPCVDERGAAGGRAGAAAAVSLHADGAAPAARGFHVAHADPGVHGTGPESLRLATTLRDGLRSSGLAPAGYIGRDGLNGRPDLAGLNTSTVPTALVEAGNMRNAEDAALLASPQGRDRYATAIADGVLTYLRR
ncbi:N-acetylmuramoyl-L-alanine amidase [Pseudonocardia sp. HH130630-07]|uniref:N-acetylmuramoyl-L-alanine amidase n=1 Tax=Pseudonocardia sp. HH130630-07 TaxID=1690815 RepID=UPI000814B9BA|nr:N-acetylmuramoyl-L-alanine amidase [Pseudonocardia sp. HH130630-07]ANY06492.1 N-acetylmuramoyl-L-alanine amidase [Pseudonocardia sp. HH130630-07]